MIAAVVSSIVCDASSMVAPIFSMLAAGSTSRNKEIKKKTRIYYFC